MHHVWGRIFWQKVKSPRWLSLPTSQIWRPVTVFPKTKITFEREEISDHWWDWGKYDGADDGGWENYVRSQGAFFEGAWGVIVLCTMFLVSCVFFNKCLYFSYYMPGYLLDRPHMSPIALSLISVFLVLTIYFSIQFSCPGFHILILYCAAGKAVTFCPLQ